MNACGVRDGLSGDMLASTWHNLILLYFLKFCISSYQYSEELIISRIKLLGLYWPDKNMADHG